MLTKCSTGYLLAGQVLAIKNNGWISEMETKEIRREIEKDKPEGSMQMDTCEQIINENETSDTENIKFTGLELMLEEIIWIITLE